MMTPTELGLWFLTATLSAQHRWASWSASCDGSTSGATVLGTSEPPTSGTTSASSPPGLLPLLGLHAVGGILRQPAPGCCWS